MPTDPLIPKKRTLLPLAGILLSLFALLMVPIFVGRQSRDLREGIQARQAPVLNATDAFRSAATDEMAATRSLIATGDAGMHEWFSRARLDREAAFAQLVVAGAALGPDAAASLGALERAVAGLSDPLASRDPGGAGVQPADTSRLWAGWEAVTASTDELWRAVDTEIAAERGRIEALERGGFILTAFLAFLAFTSAMVTTRMERQVRAFALESDRARRKQQILLDSSGEGVLGLDAAGRCTFLNPAGATLIGYSEEEALGRDVRAIILPHGSMDGDDEFLARTGFAGGVLNRAEETTIRRRDGAEVEVECLTSPVLEKNRITGAVVTIRDIGQRKAVERARLNLLQREQSLRERAEAAEHRANLLSEASELFARSLDFDTTVNSLADLIVPRIGDSCIIYAVDPAGAIQRLKPIHVDPERQRILADQLDRYPPRIESLIPPVRRALVEGESSLIDRVRVPEMKGVPGDDTHSSVIGAVGLKSLLVVPLRARGRIVGAISYGVSESGREYGPDDLRLAEDLAVRAAFALDNARLYQESQAAVSARNEVLGVVSHDLRNPLNAVRFGAQALLRHWPPHGDGEIERNQLGAITKAADRMHRLIRDLLDLAQIDSGRLAVEPGPVPVSILVNDALELASAAAVDRGVHLTVAAPVDPGTIEVDGERILQVLSNLIQNALKFSPGGGRVELGTCRGDGAVVFHVRDEGPGIDPDHIPHVFDRFWRSRNGSRDGGAGLGLAIARGIVQSHGGTIWVESALGEGSTFYVALPAGESAAIPAAIELDPIAG
jgi:PAS domain S-box-containing protein